MNSSLFTSENKRLFEKYNTRGSYYTSYPPAGLWLKNFSGDDYINALETVLRDSPSLPLQLYIHFPFCKKQCLYCQCFQLITNNRLKIKEMVGYLIKELDLLCKFFANNSINPNFREIHFGGGSPTHMNIEEFDLLVDKLRSFIDFNKLDEIAIEIDPRAVDKDKMKHYYEKGINRISFGIQDINPDVQKAVNRIQPLALIEELLDSRGLFKCISFDLIYGLPLQTRESFRGTIERVIKLSPDRIDLGVMGHRPDVFKHNSLIKDSDIPGLIEVKLMWKDSLKSLVASGYERIGMDHFAKKTDMLAKAKADKTLFRNPMGYSPGRFQDNISMGPSGMTKISNYYFQNTYSLLDYYANIDKNKFPIFRGYKLTKDDTIRRDVINQIMTYFYLNFPDIEKRYSINFIQYFSKEINSLREFAEEGILNIFQDGIRVTEFGDFFLRNICAVFDNLRKEYKHNIESAFASEGSGY